MIAVITVITGTAAATAATHSFLTILHTSQEVPSAPMVALRYHHLWFIFLFWKYCVSVVSLDATAPLSSHSYLFVVAEFSLQHGWGEVCWRNSFLFFMFDFRFLIFGFCFSRFLSPWLLSSPVSSTASATATTTSRVSIPHTSKVTLLVTPVALRYRHLWSIFLFWRFCISAVRLLDASALNVLKFM